MEDLPNRHGHRVARISRQCRDHGRLDRTRHFIQHGTTSVYIHVHSVAGIALKINDGLRLNADPDMLVRSALLHDYFLYDWHDRGHEHPRPHGFLHPRVAMNNAKEDFRLHPREENAILRHMFPLTPIPPKHREGWIICLADKISTFKELWHYHFKRQKNVSA